MSLLPAMVVCQLHEESEQGSDWKDVQLMHESDLLVVDVGRGSGGGRGSGSSLSPVGVATGSVGS